MALPSRGQGGGAMCFPIPARDDREDSGGSHQPMIGRQAEILIRGSSYLALRDVTCSVRGDTLQLQGRVPSQYLKQIAQEIAAGVKGVGRISNRIEVSARPDRSQAGHQSQEHKLHRVECNISTTCGEGNLSVD